MSASPRLPAVLRASALFDWAALVLLLWMPDALFSFFDHPRPVEPFLFRLAALPLWMAPFVYWKAASHPASPLVGVSVTLRVVGAMGIAALLLLHRPEGAAAYWSFVVADLLWAALLVALRPRA